MIRILLLASFLCSSAFGQYNIDGWSPNPELTEKIAQETEVNRIIIRELHDLKLGDKSSYNWRPLFEILKKSGQLSRSESERGILQSLDQSNEGSCVGFSAAIALDHLIANQAAKPSLRLQLKYRVNADAMYGLSRQHANQLGAWQGSTGGWIVDAFTEVGLIYRKEYGQYNLSVHNPQKAAQYRSRGIPSEVLNEIIHKGKAVRANNADEFKDALQNGLTGIVCAQASYPNSRDSDGFSRLSGRRWSHAMAVIAYRSQEETGREGFLIQNSWGNWNTGPVYPKDQPEGSFWVTKRDLQVHIDQNDSWIFLSTDGYKREALKAREIFKVQGQLPVQ